MRRDVLVERVNEILHALLIDVADLSFRGGMLSQICPVCDAPDVFFDGSGCQENHCDTEASDVCQFRLFKCDGAPKGRLEREVGPRFDMADNQPFQLLNQSMPRRFIERALDLPPPGGPATKIIRGGGTFWLYPPKSVAGSFMSAGVEIEILIPCSSTTPSSRRRRRSSSTCGRQEAIHWRVNSSISDWLSRFTALRVKSRVEFGTSSLCLNGLLRQPWCL